MPSTLISDFACNPASKTLSVWFRPSGHRYDYVDVPFDIYDELRHIASKGRFFNLRIRDRFDCDLVEDAVGANHATSLRPHFSDHS